MVAPMAVWKVASLVVETVANLDAWMVVQKVDK
jgi:hypothetical protein